MSQAPVAPAENRTSRARIRGAEALAQRLARITFDTNFALGPACLPPRTPSLRSVNTIGFSQEILPTQ